jgi:CBS domain-containing protein
LTFGTSGELAVALFAVGSDFSDAQVAEIFLHHRVLIVPVGDDGRVVGVITRADFFRSVAERFLAQ